jgi:hypothetical protein
MRKIDPIRFQVATKGTSREINRQIALNLVRTHQPISRADLARAMRVRRGAVSLLVSDLLREGLVYEGPLARLSADASRPLSTSTRAAARSSPSTSARVRRT